MRWVVDSPDGLPIEPRTYASKAAALAALASWCRRFAAQGFYASTRGRIALDELPDRCVVREVP
jgi:hypothetical protein